jgi:hypothetical protein
MGLLGLDLLLRVGRQRRAWLLLATGIFLLVASIPIMRAFITELHTGAVTGRASPKVATGIYNLYCLFVSESVAPSFWVPGIAAGLAIACCCWSSFTQSRTPGDSFCLSRRCWR